MITTIVFYYIINIWVSGTLAFNLVDISSYGVALDNNFVTRRPWHYQTTVDKPLLLSVRCRGMHIPQISRRTIYLHSSFFDKFEEQEFEDDDEDDEDDEEEDDDDDEDDESLVDDAAVADFRSRMANLFDDGSETVSLSKAQSKSGVEELISFAVKTSDAPPAWAKPATKLTTGCVLIANPDIFCSDCAAIAAKNDKKNIFNSYKIRPELLAKFGLTIPPPIDLGPDRRADLLPVLIVVEHDDDGGTNKTPSRAVLLNRRTGYLLGDLEQQQSSSDDGTTTATTPILEKFCIQPLWFGGVDSDGSGAGLDMMHQCSAVPGAVQITDDGLYWGGDPAQAQEAMDIPIMNPITGKKDKVCTGFDFKFFVQSTIYPPGALQKEIDQGTFYAVQVAKDVLFQSRDRMGTRRAKPLWTEILDLLGTDEYASIKAKIYRDEYLSSDTDSDFI
jgi:Uncharacterized ACR, COG1678